MSDFLRGHKGHKSLRIRGVFNEFNHDTFFSKSHMQSPEVALVCVPLTCWNRNMMWIQSGGCWLTRVKLDLLYRQ